MDNMLAGIKAIMDQVDKDHTSVNKNLQGIEDQQNDLMSQLTDIEAWLKTQELRPDNILKSEGIISAYPQSGFEDKEFTDIVGKAYSVYKQSLVLETNVGILAKEISQEEDGLSYPITKIFNEYYSTLEMIQEQTERVHQDLFVLENQIQNKKMNIQL
eukprot:TRINITY_DN8050_c0_g1_i2.p2 TRINITY_DN8050_c0_g1~~TRINITY_DN8050_c0_g1_i2.p2  ORF type:complete len:158 (-),score=24.61 TRINITY_DN8050_c0_g1_i2:181-654(-)